MKYIKPCFHHYSTVTENDDYTPLSQSLIFNDSTRRISVTVGINDDNISEGLETFLLELRNEIGLVNSTVVQIVDDESE